MSFNFKETIVIKAKTKGELIVKPDWVTYISGDKSDIMIKGKTFLAAYDEESGLWRKDVRFVFKQTDADTLQKYREIVDGNKDPDIKVVPLYMRNASSGMVREWNEYTTKLMPDTYDEYHNFNVLDSKVIFADTETKRDDFATQKLPYSMSEGECPAYDELMNTFYTRAELDKLEWACGSVIAGDSINIQKFLVLYGPPGSGKGSFLKTVKLVLKGYFGTLNLAQLAGEFGLEGLAANPLVGIQDDGDLSKLEDNAILNSIVSHEEVLVNEKNKKKYPMKFHTMLMMGTNRPVRITEAKSGLLRRLIDVNPTGRRIPEAKYNKLMKQLEHELGAIAYKWYSKYMELGMDYYSSYVPIYMLSSTNDFYAFVEFYYDEFADREYVCQKDAWKAYNTYNEMANVPQRYRLQYNQMKMEMENYFEDYIVDWHDKDGNHVRNVFIGFKKDKFVKSKLPEKKSKVEETWLDFNSRSSIFDVVCAACPAQLASEANSVPRVSWAANSLTLGDISTKNLHYVKPPENHIVIDFDLKDENGNKSRALNIEAASKFPPTYAELSKSEAGIHLHYIYAGDVNKLSSLYAEDVEVKVFTGNSSLRRKLTLCNDLQIATISSGLPLRKKEKKMVDFSTLKSEKQIRAMIIKNLHKEYHGATKPSIDFIKHILDQAYENKNLVYDVSDMYQAILYFASGSTHNADYCLNVVKELKLKSEAEPVDKPFDLSEESPIVFFDVEVFPNLFLINWKLQGKHNKCIRMINPTPMEVQKLFSYRLIGFNNRRYDNHILYARSQGYSNTELFNLSKKLINDNKEITSKATFANAYNLSYTDVYDFCATKQSLKKWEIDLGIHHKELGFKWDQPVPEDKWELVAEYCDNDVYATEAVFDANQGDWIARQIIAELSGLTVNASGNAHSAAIIFDGNKNPQSEFVYTDLSEQFIGYEFRAGKSYYMDEIIGEGGYVYAEPGMYENVWTFDVASMHPHSAIALNIFGDRYTKRFKDLVDLRIHIKHKEFDIVKSMFDGKLAKYVADGAEDMVKALSYALKIVINSVYGLTSAKFANAFKDPRNIDNIVAKRGALFMCTLKNKIKNMGIQVIHCKTDSIKVSNPSEELKQFIYDFGKEWGYTFEVEDIYSKLCLVNDAVYIAKEAETNEWTATGAQFKQPFVFKTLFSKEPLEFKDVCEAKQVKTAMYLSFDENAEDPEPQFVGKVGLFTPVKPGLNGGTLLVERSSGTSGTGVKLDSVTGTKGYRWVESETIAELDFDSVLNNMVDTSYYIALVDKAKDTINKFGDFEQFID